jgi:preprotein translocase subunit YajC
MQQYSSIILMLAIVAAFYILLIRPQQQQAKRQREMVASLTPGMEIVTIGGIFATIVSLADDRLRIALSDGSELEIARHAVNAIVAPLVGMDDEAETSERETHDEDAEAQGDVANA